MSTPTINQTIVNLRLQDFHFPDLKKMTIFREFRWQIFCHVVRLFFKVSIPIKRLLSNTWRSEPGKDETNKTEGKIRFSPRRKRDKILKLKSYKTIWPSQSSTRDCVTGPPVNYVTLTRTSFIRWKESRIPTDRRARPLTLIVDWNPSPRGHKGCLQGN